MNNIERIAWEAVTAGEKVLLASFQNLKPADIGFKKHHEIVTKADRNSNEAILKILRKKTPDFDVISEEGAPRKRNDCVWILDPLDGTTNYAAGLPLWGISLAYTCNYEIEVGAISLPALGERYLGIKGKGAWRITEKRKERLHVSTTRDMHDALGLLCYGYRPKEVGRGLHAIPLLSGRSRAVRRLGAAVIEAVWTAGGRSDYALLNGVHDWDVAAGALIVREAGGDVTTPHGKPWMLGESDILFSTPGLTKKLHAILK